MIGGIDDDGAGTLARRISDFLTIIARVDLFDRHGGNVVSCIGDGSIHGAVLHRTGLRLGPLDDSGRVT